MNKRGNGLFEAHSAGSFPIGKVNPDSVIALKNNGYKVEGVVSKSWDSLYDMKFDIVITVCDNAASETCPTYLSEAIVGHWGIKDPDKITSTDRNHAFDLCYQQLLVRIDKLLSLSKITKHSINHIGITSL